MPRSTRHAMHFALSATLALMLFNITADLARSAALPAADLALDGGREKVNFAYATSAKYHRAMVTLRDTTGTTTERKVFSDDGTGSGSGWFTGLPAGTHDYDVVLRVQWKPGGAWHVMDTATTSTY